MSDLVCLFTIVTYEEPLARQLSSAAQLLGQLSWTAALAASKQGHWSAGIDAQEVVAVRAKGTGGLYEMFTTRLAFDLHRDDHNRWERLRKALGFVNAEQSALRHDTAFEVGLTGSWALSPLC